MSLIPPSDPQDLGASNPNPFMPPEYDLPVVELADQDFLEAKPQRLSAGGIIAWLMVALAVCSLVLLVAVQQVDQATAVGGDATEADLMQAEIQTKMLIGQGNIDKVLPIPAQKVPEQEVPTEIDAGCYEQRLVYASIKNEVEGPESARDYLQTLDERVEELQAEEIEAGVPAEERFELTEDQREMRNAMGELLTEYEAGNFSDSSVSEESKDLLKERLGFPGELFLVPEGTTQQAARDELVGGVAASFGIMMLLGLLGLMAGFVGLGCCVVFPVMISQNKLVSYFFHSPSNHNIYIQTFAIWLFGFFGVSMLLGMLGLSQETSMVLQPFVFFGSLLCLVYPLLRGITFRQLRYDIGWTIDRPVGDTAFAGVSYLATLPCLIPGLIAIAILTAIAGQVTELHEFARQTAPGHPIQEYLSSGNWFMILMVFIAACIAAPVVEETMFRGVLYRHLRDWSQPWARWVSVAFSAVLNGFVFAAIHPQGIAAIPVLMTLAICFSLVREWRNSLLTPMLMHAIHNTLVTCISLTIL